MSNITYYYNGKQVANKKAIPKGAKLHHTHIVHEEYLCDELYEKQQDKNAYAYFAKMRQMREDMDKYHG